MAFVIPGLHRKLDILISRGGAEDKKAIAKQLDISMKTLNWYAHGAATRQAGQIPYERLDALVELFRGCFPSTISDADIAQTLRLSVTEFEQEIETLWAPSWETLIAEHGIYDRGKLFFRETDSHLVEVGSNSRDDLPVVPLRSWFRLEFPSLFHGEHLLGIQLGGGLIGRLPVERNDVHDRLIAPGYKDDREFSYMRERRDEGVHQFIAIQSARPFPNVILQEFYRGTAIETATLQKLAVHLVACKEADWKVFVQRLQIEA